MKKEFVIGRDPSNDVVIYDPNDIVSRSHATLRVDGKKYFIIDHSTNGTYRNGVRLTPNEEYRIDFGDEISFANVARLDWDDVPKSKDFPWLPVLISLLIASLVCSIIFSLIPRLREKNEMIEINNSPTVVKDTSVIETKTDTVVLKKVIPTKSKKKRKKAEAVAKTPVKDELIINESFNDFVDEDNRDSVRYDAL